MTIDPGAHENGDADRADNLKVFVELRPLGVSSDIGFGKPPKPDLLANHITEIQAALSQGTEAVASGLSDLSAPAGWSLNEVSASFGVQLSAEAGVIVSKASAGASLEVTVTFQKQP